jgi:prepilin-type N-terminal cleavage/methylation domain-containing protein
MRRANGFTLIEVLITITVMVVLLVLAVVSMSGGEANARDEERKTDIAVLAEHFESYYSSGIDASMAIGEYPSTVEIDTESEVTALLRGIDPKTIRTPTVDTTSPMSFVVATNNSTSAPTPAPTTSNYVYQPLTSTGALCNTAALECRKFNLYYKIEGTATMQTVTSKNQ